MHLVWQNTHPEGLRSKSLIQWILLLASCVCRGIVPTHCVYHSHPTFHRRLLTCVLVIVHIRSWRPIIAIVVDTVIRKYWVNSASGRDSLHYFSCPATRPVCRPVWHCLFSSPSTWHSCRSSANPSNDDGTWNSICKPYPLAFWTSVQACGKTWYKILRSHGASQIESKYDSQRTRTNKRSARLMKPTFGKFNSVRFLQTICPREDMLFETDSCYGVR